MNKTKLLTKSLFTTSLDCPHRLYYTTHKELYDNSNSTTLRSGRGWLYLIVLYIKPQPDARAEIESDSCILFDFYIKPQPVALIV